MPHEPIQVRGRLAGRDSGHPFQKPLKSGYTPSQTRYIKEPCNEIVAHAVFPFFLRGLFQLIAHASHSSPHDLTTCMVRKRTPYRLKRHGCPEYARAAASKDLIFQKCGRGWETNQPHTNAEISPMSLGGWGRSTRASSP